MKYMLRKLALASCIGMFLVLLMGTLVTKTESGRGCGDDWPLCNGKFIPAYTVESMIEYSHRFVTGIEGLLVLGATVGVYLYTKRKDARFYAASSLFFTVIQAAMGALAVIWPQSSSVLALHFGFSLLAFASTFLLVMALRRLPDSGMEPPKVSMPARKPKPSLPTAEGGGSRPGGLSMGTSILLWVTAAYTYVVVYLGAYVRHTDSSGGCGRDWPLCAGEVVPSLTGATGIMFIHRLGAVLLFVFIAYLMYRLNRETDRPDMAKAGRAAFQLVVIQVFSGALVTFALGTDSYLFASLLHTVIIAALFSTLSYLCALWVTGPQKTAAAL